MDNSQSKSQATTTDRDELLLCYSTAPPDEVGDKVEG
jgi:hypothetical protein